MTFTPRYLLCHDDGKFFVFETGGRSYDYDIVSYCWGDRVEPYDCGVEGVNYRVEGVNWPIQINPKKIMQFKKLMRREGIKCLWADSLCINKTDLTQAAEELSKMFQYYKQAKNCYLLIETPRMFNPKRIADDLKLLDHIQSTIDGASIIYSNRLPPELEARRRRWAEQEPWARDEMPQSLLRSAGIDLGVMNCYNTCVSHVTSLFANEYFTRVWTFQEMILGKNIQIIGVTPRKMSRIGFFNQWMELAYDCRDKATKIYDWINMPRNVNTMFINSVLHMIGEDHTVLSRLQIMVRGIQAARIDIINGGQSWWLENQKGVSNIFSTIAIRPRACTHTEDLFRGLLGIFSGLLTPNEIEKLITGDDLEKMSFAFFKKLSEKTGVAWTRLAVGSRDRGELDWIPVVEQAHDANAEVADEVKDESPETSGQESEEDVTQHAEGEDEEWSEETCNEDETAETAAARGKGSQKKQTKLNHIKTDIFASVTPLGYLGSRGRAKTQGLTGLLGKPRPLMSIHLKEVRRKFHFAFQGCNHGKKRSLFGGAKKTGAAAPAAVDVSGDETGRVLAQCATILGCVLDPAGDVLAYKTRLLGGLDPQWHTTDPSARPSNWPERCVSGTTWADAACAQWLHPHNMAMSYRLGAVTECRSRLAQSAAADVSCELRVNCGCVVTAPLSMMMHALAAVEDGSLDHTNPELKNEDDDRITLRDGLGLLQIGDLGKTFHIVAFDGDVRFHRRHAARSLGAKKGTAVPSPPVETCPAGRVLIRADFVHKPLVHMLRNYGYVDTGAGKLFVCRSHPLGSYRIRGACIDRHILQKKDTDEREVRIK